MSEAGGTELQTTAETNGAGGDAESMLAQLRAERQALTEVQRLDLGVPGYSHLVARYRAIDYGQIRRVMATADQAVDPDDELATAQLNAYADILARCCVGMFLREDSGKLTPLHTLREAWGENPVVYDARLAEAVGKEGSSAREVIHNVFGTFEPETSNSMKLDRHVLELFNWIRGRNADADADF